ncbi:MAG: hypothetical protein GQ532_09865 [Methylomarinum sp.]|nr:hypothetical protein [Methylococcales bacterium]NOR69979.1 hypothetical protein [Methylomarinum sp.]
MKLIKTIALSLFMILSTLGISSVAFAGANQDVDKVSAKISEASKAIDSGASSDEVMFIIKEAAGLVGELQLNDNVVAKRQRASGALKKARRAAKKGNLEASKKHLEDASNRFSKIKSLI